MSVLGLLFTAVSVSAQTSPVDPLAPTRDTKSAAEIDHEWQHSVAKYDGERNRLLSEAEKQANNGPYRPDWATLIKYQQPQWYKDAKFGIFIHWGVYSVPAAENEWYPRNMYEPKEGADKNFREHFALRRRSPNSATRTSFRCFKREHFDAAEWARALQAGGRAVRGSGGRAPRRLLHVRLPACPTGRRSRWAPSATSLGELAKAVRAEGLHFGTELASRRARFLL